MKTMRDIKIMKAQPCTPFGSAYSYLIARLSDYYISKTNGIERIMNEIAEWDTPSQEHILNCVIEEISKNCLLTRYMHRSDTYEII